ncbi:MAG: hypothetical protein KGJ93_02070 [Patescibacteria group bacterium]|nr:hypothetical protein [Patescibacteria group bacterium]
MLLILLGSDDFSKAGYISSLARQHHAGVEFFVSAEERPDLADFFGRDLFSQTKIAVLQNLLGTYEYRQDMAEKLRASKNFIVFEQAKLDRRVASNKQWLGHKGAEVKEFFLPHGAELELWLVARAKVLNGTISKAAAARLAQKLGRDDAVETKIGGKIVEIKEIFDLWQADSEIRKLLAYAGGREVSESDVQALVSQSGEVDSLRIVNAIADGKKTGALDLIGKFLVQGGDEKAAVIQLNALLSEQFRNIFVIQEFLSKKWPDAQILDATGWKTGRLFVLKKIAVRFKPVKVKDLLGKLAALDAELKTSATPPRVLLDLIIGQLLT